MAIVLDEADKPVFRQTMPDADSIRMSVANWLEAPLVIQGMKQPAMTSEFDALIARLGVELVPADVQQARLARVAGLRFGRKHHRAKLNYGDCFAYARSKLTGEPLLFKGDDLPQTDIDPALPR